MIATINSPHTNNTAGHMNFNANINGRESEPAPCDCAHFKSLGQACPCSVAYAAKIGKRAVERILHKSVFFNEDNIAGVELQTQAETAASDWKSIGSNKVVEVDADHLDVGHVLGKGGFCLVHDVDIVGVSDQPSDDDHHIYDLARPNIEIQDQELPDYCVKFLKPGILPDRRKFARGIADLAIEAHFLATLNHPHILKIRGVTTGIKLFRPTHPDLTCNPGIDSGFFLILDKLHSTLDQKITQTWKQANEKYSSFIYRTAHDLRGAKRRGFKIERICVVLQLAQAMQYLHARKICYRDLKPDNIGFDINDSLKLFDFGLAKELKPYKRHSDGTYHLTANTGSRRYMAPEVALRKRYNLSVDVFSFAILLWEICALEKPFEGFSELQHMTQVVQRGLRPKIDTLKAWPLGIRTILVESWHPDMTERPSFEEIVRSLIQVKSEFTNE